MSNGFEKTERAATERGLKDAPHGWIQWKGTNVCMDVSCPCGHPGHIDSWFAYHLKCAGCGKVWTVSPYVELIECTDPEDAARAVEMVADE